MPAFVAQRKPVALLCQSAAGGATRRFGRGAASEVDPWFPLNHDTGVTIRESKLAREMHNLPCTSRWVLEQEQRDQLDQFRRPSGAPMH
jgi:hypothetical protein